MDFVKKNSAWIALAALVLAGYLYYDLKMKKETGYTGKVSVKNPINA